MYHLTVGGHLVRNLRLSPLVLMEIFTGAITNWDNSAITKIYGAQLPNEPIVPVLRSDGSGATYFFTRWMSVDVPQPVECLLQEGASATSQAVRTDGVLPALRRRQDGGRLQQRRRLHHRELRRGLDRL